MDRPLKMWEFIAGLIVLAVTFGSIIYNCGTVSGRMELRMTTAESKIDNTDKKVDKIGDTMTSKMDEINNKLFDIKLLLETKQDKKK
jgi:hypothetical protein